MELVDERLRCPRCGAPVKVIVRHRRGRSSLVAYECTGEGCDWHDSSGRPFNERGVKISLLEEICPPSDPSFTRSSRPLS